MKRNLVLGGLVLFFIGLGLYLGWVTRSVPLDQWAVGHSKVRGWEKRVFEPSEFAWRWERLIPGMYAVYLYPAKPFPVQLTLKGELPSGPLYGQVLENKPAFSFEISAQLQVGFDKASFPNLVASEGITPENWDSWTQKKQQEIAQDLSGMILESALPQLLNLPHPKWQETLRLALTQRWSERFPSLTLLSLSFPHLQVPDVELYQKAKSLVLGVEEAKRETLMQESRRRLLESAAEERRIESLKRYGELLKTYPLLLEFLAIEKMGQISPGDLKTFRELRSQPPPD